MERTSNKCQARGNPAARQTASKDSTAPSPRRFGFRLPRIGVGLISLGLVAFLAAGCSRTPNATEIERIKSLGGHVEIDPADKSVVKAWLSKTDADDEDMRTIARLPQLRELYLIGTQLTDEGTKQLTGLSKLETLDIYNTSIDDAGIANLANLTALIRLAVGRTKISDAALTSLASLPNLQELRLEGTEITDAAMPAIAKISGLRSLSLDNTKITGAGVEKLRGLTALERLGIVGTAADDRAVPTLSGMTSLKLLYVSRSRLSPEGMAAIRKALPKVSVDWPPAPKPAAANQAGKGRAVAVNGVIRIKAGSSVLFTDSNGNVWQPEMGFDGGKVTVRGRYIQIENTKDPDLYRTLHYGMASFSCDVLNGKYIAKLHFAETYQGIHGEGQRVFSFNVQGHEFKGFDMWKMAGGSNRAYVETVPVEVTHGKFQITFTKQVENPQINAIELAPQAGSTPATTPATAPTQTAPPATAKASPCAIRPAGRIRA